ncbi:PREDICTED: palmitoyl-protein thioesterase 3-like isoform X1 [Camelina sativa]|uniref:Palmitoyl-protein thioesterase 3-like isoform X1 n=1 Tax=Camelina sativa TaxID=90675 RepID=A0ABM1QRK7_CAMSA|nr:PREDICTED: palmitoyl-protein thioesterase 3-like isoform X1 [Camelina sativa]
MEKSLQRSVLLVTLSLFFFSIPVSLSVPFVLFHGIAGECSNDEVSNLTKFLNNYSSSPGSCVEIGNGLVDSLYMPLTQQASIACEKIKQMPELSEGYNIVGLSQGNFVARGLIEFCDNAPLVFNYVSLGGPHAGLSDLSKFNCSVCELLDIYLSDVYNDFVQDHAAPSGCFKIPTDIKNYLEHSKYLPKLNNERPGEKNSTYKDRFTSLHNLVLIMFEKDNVLTPKESCWFGYYPDGAYTPILPPQKTKLYTEDWIGLKTLDDAGKVKFVSVPGGHMEITKEELIKYVVPYLQNESTSSSEI